jgi:hypothetical protein
MTLRLLDRRNQTDKAIEPPESRPRPHLSSRTGLITLYAVLGSVLVGALAYAGDHRPAAAAAAGVLAFGGVFLFFDKIIGD